MYTDRFSLPFLSGVLMAAAERLRPGLGAWSPEVRAKLEDVFREELARVKPGFLEIYGDEAHWAQLEEALLTECFPRYAALAEKETALELREYDLWRGGDLLSRGAFAGLGLAVGAFLVKSPWIPIPETWDFLILAMGLGGPFLPDLQVSWAKRKYARAIERVMVDMREAQESRKLYEPLGLAGAPSAVAEVATPSVDASVPVGREKTKA